MNTYLVLIYLLPALVMLAFIGGAAPVSRRGSIAAVLVALLASLLAVWSPPDALSNSIVARIARHFAGQAGLGLLVFLPVWTATRYLLALAGLLVGGRRERRSLMQGPPHGTGGWFHLLSLRLLLEPLSLALLVLALFTVDGWTLVTRELTRETLWAPLHWSGMSLSLLALGTWIALFRAVLRRTRSMRSTAIVFFTAALATNILTLGTQIVLDGEVVSDPIAFLRMAVDAFLLAYVIRSRRVHATFTADPRSAPSTRRVLWNGFRSFFNVSRWPAALKRAVTGQASLAGVFIALPFWVAGSTLAVLLTQEAVVPVILALGFLAIWAWRAAQRIRREHRFGALVWPLAALPIVVGAALVTNAYVFVRTLPPPSVATVQGEVLRIEGGINPGLFEQVAELLERNPQVVRIDLTSPGGHVETASRIGELIRTRGFATRAIGTCASACTSIFMAGLQRDLAPNARLGFHSAASFGFDMNWDDRHVQRLRQLGAKEAFIQRALNTPSDRMWYPTPAELQENGIVTRAQDASTGSPPPSVETSG